MSKEFTEEDDALLARARCRRRTPRRLPAARLTMNESWQALRRSSASSRRMAARRNTARVVTSSSESMPSGWIASTNRKNVAG